MYQSLYEHINHYVGLTEEQFQYCQTFFRYKRMRKRQYILQEGQVQASSFFILNGLVRMYEIDDRGGEHIFQFHHETEWVLPIASLDDEVPASYNLDCLEDTEVLILNNAAKVDLINSLPIMGCYFYLQLQKSYTHLVRRVSSHLSKPTAERYYEFVEQHRLLEQRVPNHWIASYLGVTPQSLSRIRAQNRLAIH